MSLGQFEGEGCTTEARATNGGVKVERRFNNVVVDRYNTADLAKPPKRLEKWMKPLIAAASADKSPDIPVPPVPPISESIFDKVQRLEAENRQLTTELANRAVSELQYARRCQELEVQLSQKIGENGD